MRKLGFIKLTILQAVYDLSRKALTAAVRQEFKPGSVVRVKDPALASDHGVNVFSTVHSIYESVPGHVFMGRVCENGHTPWHNLEIRKTR